MSVGYRSSFAGFGYRDMQTHGGKTLTFNSVNDPYLSLTAPVLTDTLSSSSVEAAWSTMRAACNQLVFQRRF